MNNWMWDGFPEDSSTWQCCVEEHDALSYISHMLAEALYGCSPADLPEEVRNNRQKALATWRKFQDDRKLI